MIGSHDSFTYMEARSPLVNAFKGLWRTQDKSIEEQFRAGVRFFDIRLFRDGSKWRAAHGLAEFDAAYPTLLRAAKDIAKRCPGCRFQIWLEKGTDEDWELFKAEAKKDLADCLAMAKEDASENGEDFPEVEFEYKYDLQSFFNYFTFLNVSEIAKRAGINPSLMRQYSSGIKKAGEKTYERLSLCMDGIKKDLSVATF